MTVRFQRTWPGIDPAAWPKMNELAEAVETSLNWRTDGTLQVIQGQGSMYGVVPPPPGFMAVILGGTDPYSWAKLKPDITGIWYSDPDAPLVGYVDARRVATIIGASWVSNIVTFTAGEDISAILSIGEIVTVTGTNPAGYDDTYTVLTIANSPNGTVFTASKTTDPGIYLASGVVYLAAASTDTAFRPAYEHNGNKEVPVGTRVWMMPRILNVDDEETPTDLEHRFDYPSCCEILLPEPPRLLIQDEGTSLPKRPTLNFIGSSVATADNTTSQRTDVTVTLSSTTLPSSLGGWWNNLLINGGWNYAQRQTPGTLTTISDQAYSADRWKIEQSAAGLQYKRFDATAETAIGAKWYGQFKKITGAGKFIVYQWVLGQNSFPLRGKDAYYTIWLKSNSIRNIKASVIVLGSGGTINAPPTPIVSSYGPFSTVANVTLASGSGSGNTLAVATSWTGYGGVAAGLSTSLLNIGFAFWPEDDFAVNDVLDVAMTQMGLGDGVAVVRPWMERHAQQELALCRHFYRKSFNVDTPPSQNLGTGTGEMTCGAQASGAANNQFQRVMFDPPMWDAPAVTTYNPAAANAEVRDETSAGDCSATAVNDIEETGFDISTTGNAGTLPGEKLGVHWSAVKEIP